MDNLTHSLVGLVVGEAMARCAPADSSGLPAATRRTALMWVGAIGSNLPDIDLLWSGAPGAGDSLGYLLEHRGYSHTVLGCALLAGLLHGAAVLYLRVRGAAPSARDHLSLAFVAVLGVFLHLGMDALNSYGVHPFWPWNNRWFYGDALFIVEPLCWVAVAPLLFVWRSTAARVVLPLILLVANVVALAVYRWHPLAWSLPLLTLLLALPGRRVAPRMAALTSVAMLLVVVAAFVVLSHLAARRVDAMARQHFAGWNTLDTVLSPLPTHPGCWDVLLVQSGGGRYVVRHGSLSLLPVAVAAACPQLPAGQGTAPITPVSAPIFAGMMWLGEFSLSQQRLQSLIASDCAAGELLQFIRAPFAAEHNQRWILGDMRFDREPGVGMAELEIDPARKSACRHHVPWKPPRADLLGNPH